MYDGENRLVEKKIPDAGRIFTIYDLKGRVVASQDSLMRTQKKWMFTKYDVLGKPVIKGTRITVEHILRKLSEGMSPEALLEAYPHLEKEDILTALAYSMKVI